MVVLLSGANTRGSGTNFENGFNFDGLVAGKAVHAYGRTGTAADLLAKNFDQQIRAAIYDPRVILEISLGIDHSQQLHDSDDPVERPQSLLSDGQQIEARQASMLIGILNADIVADFTPMQVTTIVERPLSREKQQVAGAPRHGEVRDRRRHGRQADTECRKA